MSDLQGFNCKSCGAPYVPNSEKCDYCGTWFRSQPLQNFWESRLGWDMDNLLAHHVDRTEHQQLIRTKYTQKVKNDSKFWNWFALGTVAALVCIGSVILTILLGTSI